MKVSPPELQTQESHSWKSSDFVVVVNRNAGELPEALATMMRENSLALEEIKKVIATRKSLP